MGNGRYTSEWTLGSWVKYNNASRVVYNFEEQLVFILPLELVVGLFSPVWIAILGAVYLFGRIIYSIGYCCKGANWREPGALVMIVWLGIFYLAFYHAIDLILSAS